MHHEEDIQDAVAAALPAPSSSNVLWEETEGCDCPEVLQLCHLVGGGVGCCSGAPLRRMHTRSTSVASSRRRMSPTRWVSRAAQSSDGTISGTVLKLRFRVRPHLRLVELRFETTRNPSTCREDPEQHQGWVLPLTDSRSGSVFHQHFHIENVASDNALTKGSMLTYLVLDILLRVCFQKQLGYATYRIQCDLGNPILSGLHRQKKQGLESETRDSVAM